MNQNNPETGVHTEKRQTRTRFTEEQIPAKLVVRRRRRRRLAVESWAVYFGKIQLSDDVPKP